MSASIKVKCPDCSGTGALGSFKSGTGYPCSRCDGAGWIYKSAVTKPCEDVAMERTDGENEADEDWMEAIQSCDWGGEISLAEGAEIASEGRTEVIASIHERFNELRAQTAQLRDPVNTAIVFLEDYLRSQTHPGVSRLVSDLKAALSTPAPAVVSAEEHAKIQAQVVQLRGALQEASEFLSKLGSPDEVMAADIHGIRDEVGAALSAPAPRVQPEVVLERYVIEDNGDMRVEHPPFKDQPQPAPRVFTAEQVLPLAEALRECNTHPDAAFTTIVKITDAALAHARAIGLLEGEK
jgi:hypothetical protein